MSKSLETSRLSHLDLLNLKHQNQRIAALTSYDASFAQLCQKAGIELIIVGDSLGMVLQGRHSTIGVSLEDMIYHTSLVAKGCSRPLIMSDMPFSSYEESPAIAFRSAAKLLEAGANMVKIEGGQEFSETTKFLSTRGIPVCAHIGLTPQRINQLGSYKIVGKTADEFERVKKDALVQQQAGAAIILIEAVPNKLALAINEILKIPSIGIGAGDSCSGQVLVIYDILDITFGKKPKFVKNFLDTQPSILEALKLYVDEVKSGKYPGAEHSYNL